MSDPLVSIVTSAYNAEKTIVYAVESVLTQTYQNFEYIIIDHGSTDRTGELLEKLSRKDPRVKIIRILKNTGCIGKALNLGLQQANGMYITFLDADDWFNPDHLEKMVQPAEDMQSDIVICGFLIRDENHHLLKTFSPGDNLLTRKEDWNKYSEFFFTESLSFACFDFWWNKLYKLSFLRKHSISFPESKNVYGDSEFNHGCFKFFPNVVTIPSTSINYFQYRSSTTHTYYIGNYKDRIDYICRWKLFFKQHGYIPKFAITYLNRFLCTFHGIATTTASLDDTLRELQDWYENPIVHSHLSEINNIEFALNELELGVQLLAAKYCCTAKDLSYWISQYYNIILSKAHLDKQFNDIFEIVFKEDNPCMLGIQWIADDLTCF